MKPTHPMLASSSISHTKVAKPASNSLSQLLASLKGQPLEVLKEQTRHVDWSAPIFTWTGREMDSRLANLVHPWVCVLRSQNLDACRHFLSQELPAEEITQAAFSTGARHTTSRQPLSKMSNIWGWGVLREALVLGMPEQAQALLPLAMQNLMQAPHQATEMLGLAKAFVASRGLTQEQTVGLIQSAGQHLEQSGYAKACEFLPERIMDESCRVGHAQMVQWMASPPFCVNRTYAHAISLAKAGAMEEAFAAVNHARTTHGGADKISLEHLVSQAYEFLLFAQTPAFNTMPKGRAEAERAAGFEMGKWLLLRHSRSNSKGYLDEAFGWDALEETSAKLSVIASLVPSEWVLPTFRGREFPPETVACLLAEGRGQSDFAQCILPSVAAGHVDDVVQKTIKKLTRSKAWSRSLSRSKLVEFRSLVLLETIEPLGAALGLDVAELVLPHLPSELRGSDADIQAWKRALAQYRQEHLDQALVENTSPSARKMRF